MSNLGKNLTGYFLGLMILAVLTSCGKTKKYYSTEVIENTEVIEVLQEFEGSFYMSDNSFIEFYQSDSTLLITTKNQLLTTLNPVNNTFGELPKLSGEYEIVDNKVRFTKNLNYTPGNDIEDDTNGNDIRGQRRTDVTIEFIDSRLHITYEIYANKTNDNVNYIVAKRILIQE